MTVASGNASAGDTDGSANDSVSIIDLTDQSHPTVNFDTVQENKTIRLTLYGRLNQTATADKTINIELVDAVAISSISSINGGSSVSVGGTQAGLQYGAYFGLVSAGATTTFLGGKTATDSTDSRYAQDSYSATISPADQNTTATYQGRVVDRTSGGSAGTSISANTSTFTVYPLLTTSKNTIYPSRNTIYSDVQADDTSTYPPTVSYQTPQTATDNVSSYLYSAGTSLTGHGFSAATSATTTYGGGSGVGSSRTSLRIRGTGASGTQETTTTHDVTVNYEPRVFNISYSTANLSGGNFVVNSSTVTLTALDWQGKDVGSSGFACDVYAAATGGSPINSSGSILRGTPLTSGILDGNTGGAQIGDNHCKWTGTVSLGTVSSTGTVYVRVTDQSGSPLSVYSETLSVASWNNVSVTSDNGSGFASGEDATELTGGDFSTDTKSYLGTLGNGTVLYNDANGTGGVFNGGSDWHNDDSNNYVMVVNASGVVSSYTADANIIPKAPTSITFSSVTTSQIVIGWTDNSAIEDGFKVYMNTGGAATSAHDLINTASANATSYTKDSGLSAGTTYYFAVYAYNGSSLSSVIQGSQATDEVTSWGSWNATPSHNLGEGNSTKYSANYNVTLTAPDTGTNEVNATVSSVSGMHGANTLYVAVGTSTNPTNYAAAGSTAQTTAVGGSDVIYVRFKIVAARATAENGTFTLTMENNGETKTDTGLEWSIEASVGP